MTDYCNRRLLIIDDNEDIHADIRKSLGMFDDDGEDEALDALHAELFGGGDDGDDGAASSQAPPAEQYQIDSAFQGMEGLERVEQALRSGRPYAMAFVDMRMPPGWDGVETIQRLWRVDPNLQVVICTAYSDYSPTEIARKLSTGDRLTIIKKPFDSVEILLMARALCHKWTLQREVERQMLLLEDRATVMESQLAAIVESSTDAILTARSGVIEHWNQAAERMFGYAHPEIVGRPIEALVHPDFRQELRGISEQIQRGELVAPFESRWVTKGGASVDVSVALSPVHDPSHTVFGIAMTLRDIGPHKELERELRDARTAAEASAQAKSEFLANMSHEIRTPMNGVVGMSALLLDTELTEVQRKYAHTIRDSARSLIRVLNDVLDHSKIEAGKLELEVTDFHPRAVLASILDLFTTMAGEKSVALQAEIGDDVPDTLRGDPHRLRQILINLIGNALKFTKKGSVRIAATVEPTPAEPARIRFAVTDTGIGISPEAQRRLFQPFTQADGSTTRRYGGTGLGLTITSRLVSLMGGTMGVDSTPGRGSTFWFTIACVAAAPGDRSSTAQSSSSLRPISRSSSSLRSVSRSSSSLRPISRSSSSLRPISRSSSSLRSVSRSDAPRPSTSGVRPISIPTGARVLIADSDSVNVLILKALVFKLGYRAENVTSGQAVLDAVANRRCDAVLFDCKLPDITGLDLATRLRDQCGDHGVPLVALTSSRVTSHERLTAAGVSACLAKPVSADEVAEILPRLLARRGGSAAAADLLPPAASAG